MKISIITVTFNSAKFIEHCAKSIKSQSYSDIEWIVIDGLSTDNTLEIVSRYIEDNDLLVSEPDSGIYNAMNKGIFRASGDVIGFLNSDDIYDNPEVLKVFSEAFRKDSSLQAVYGNLTFYEEQMNSPVRDWEFKGEGLFQEGWHPAHPTFYARRELFFKYGGFKEQLSMSADFELMLRFLEKYKVNSRYINMPIVKMRIGGASTGSIGNILRGISQTRKAFIMNEIKYPFFYPIFRYLPKLKTKISSRF